MNLPLLTREDPQAALAAVTPQKVRDDDADRRKFFAEVRKTLGYKTEPPMSPAPAHPDDAEAAAASLQQCLEDLDIRPFRRVDVDAYLAAAEEQVRRAATWDGRGFACVLGIIISVAVGAIVLPQIVAMPIAFTVVAGAAGTLSLASVIGCVICVNRWFAYVNRGFHSTARWVWRPLSQYSEPVPEFALQAALDIKQRVPEAAMEICALEQNRTSADPFLVVSIPGLVERLYVEVWNEPGFSKVREQ